MNISLWVVLIGFGVLAMGARASLLPDAVSDVANLTDAAPSMYNNLAAFLTMIRLAETGRSDDSAYSIFYGGSDFSNFSDHPVVTGEKVPVKLSPELCVRAGYSSGNCVSTAAGAYQINLPTWAEFRADSGDGYGYRASFTPDDQDAVAIRILAHDGAIDSIMSGNFNDALYTASRRWASLPNSTAGQGGSSAGTLFAWYTQAGGQVV